MDNSVDIDLNVSPCFKPIEKPKIRINGLSRKIIFILASYGLEGGLTLGDLSSFLNSREEVKEKAIKQALYRLRKRGLVWNFKRKWGLTKQGLGYYNGVMDYVSSVFENRLLEDDLMDFYRHDNRVLFRGLVDEAVITECRFNHCFKPNPDLCFSLDTLKQAGVIEVEETKDMIRVKPSILLKTLILSSKRISKKGLVEIKQLKDTTVRRRRVYERVFRVKKKPLPIEELKAYVESLRKRFPKRGISLVEEHDKIVLTHASLPYPIVFIPRLNDFRIFVLKQDFNEKQGLIMHRLRCILTKLKLLEKPKYNPIKGGLNNG